MHERLVLIRWVVLIFCTAGFLYADQAEDIEAIRNLHERHHEAFSSGNAEAHASYFTEDGILMPPNEPLVAGIEGIKFWDQSSFQLFTAELKTISIDRVIISGDWAYSQSTYSAKITYKEDGSTMRGDNKSIHIYRRQADGSWKISCDMWNGSGPVRYGE